MKYCYVEDGKIIEGPKTLPTAWKNISGLNHCSGESLKQKGWLPLVEIIPEYDATTYYLGDVVLSVEPDRVIMSQPVLAKTQEQLDADALKVATEYQRLRQMEYPDIDELIVALWEMVVEDRPEFSVELQKKRMLVKEKYPKPNIVT